MGYTYSVYFEGTTEVHSDKPLTEEEIFDKATDIIEGDARTRLDNNFDIAYFKRLDTEEDDVNLE